MDMVVPKIELLFNKKTIEEEKRIFLMFWRNNMSIHSKLNYILNESNEPIAKMAISNFLDKYYKRKATELKNNFNKVIEEWFLLENSYFDKVNKFLNNYPWPKGNYRGSASVLYCFPRNIKGKWFTFPINVNFNAMQVIAHEMLHFILYDYMEVKYGLMPSECNDVDNKFWQFSENLNALIEDEEIWQEFMKGNKANVKPECKCLYEEMKIIWNKDKNIDNLIEKIFNI